MVDILTVPIIDFAEAVEEICSFIKDVVGSARGVVLGLSGGVDSSVTATLCVKALGSNRVLALLMPLSFTPKSDVEDAVALADWLGINYKVIPIDSVVEALLRVLPYEPSDPAYKMPTANLRARVRMSILYYYANLYGLLVAGTSDKSEVLIGYYTKYGDGAADFLPIAHLYKTQVRSLAKWLGIPERIAYKPSSPQLYAGHKATDELPVDYQVLDRILVGLFEHKLKPSEVARKLEIPESVVLDVVRRYESTSHKRKLPPTVKPLPFL
ncbi:MAG: NAD+ synthase [Candidatus Bathyarchaeia archaeon]